MKKIFCIVWSLFFCLQLGFHTVRADDTLKLYAKSAILMDAGSGRVLFDKSGKTKMPNASTTKILTCLYIIKHCNLEEEATVSKNAAAQPQVHLGARAGEKYKVKDLLYGLMLESYNDCAVILAEHAAGSTENFAKKLNEEARSFGAKSTHFVTPNGLDRTDKSGIHSTTAYDLALIMKQCIKNKEFLEITRAKSHSFHDVSGKRSFTCNNHNALLSMMDGAVSGKTGFTSKAGYCYVGAVKKNGMTMIAVVLACGWPPHKTYKWSDVRTLVDYGAKNYSYHKIIPDYSKLTDLYVNGGMEHKVSVEAKGGGMTVLLKKGEKVDIKCQIPKSLDAPVKKKEQIGRIEYVLNGKVIREEKIFTKDSIDKKDYWWYLGKTLDEFCL